jgi:glycosyltransferase involved in cell wall biosynthesis
MIGTGYDLAGRLAGVGGHRLVVGQGVVDGDGIVASLVEAGELRDPDRRGWPPSADATARLAWAGRLVQGKGLEALLGALVVQPGLTLEFVGDGPARDRLEAIAAAGGVASRVRWAGHVADRAAYLDRLAAADAFVFPSPAEGFPKVVLDALAIGLPVLATRVGALAALADTGIVEPIGRPDADAIEAAWQRLLRTDGAVVADRRRRGVAFAAGHTRPAEVARLVARWRVWWPALPWDR